ncbi:MAG: polyprenyl synthetase family protein [Bacteroidetes bacterium]|nr:polyprenyl synthetase family protein [Bacteroidota bacterium]
MMNLDDIKRPVEKHLSGFEKTFKGSMKSPVPLLNIIMNYIIKRKGKQLRPMFVFFAADLNGEVTEATYRAASLIELLHTATLIHDDVVDDSNLRRGFFSINALWKNKIAVLAGDYLLSRGLLLSLENGDFHLLQIVSNAVREMSEGELMQIEKAWKLNIREEDYFDIIRKKTASLIASCCAVGAASVGADEDHISLMRTFGEKVGIAFQIKDDLFDYEHNNLTGKPTGVDIKEHKMTLPLIYVLNNADGATHRRVINIIRHNHRKPEKVEQVMNLVNESGGIRYAREKMLAYRSEAIALLNHFPDKPTRQSLEQLVLYTTERNK